MSPMNAHHHTFKNNPYAEVSHSFLCGSQNQLINNLNKPFKNLQLNSECINVPYFGHTNFRPFRNYIMLHIKNKPTNPKPNMEKFSNIKFYLKGYLPSFHLCEEFLYRQVTHQQYKKKSK